MVKRILMWFGYTKIPKETIQISVSNEYMMSIFMRATENDIEDVRYVDKSIRRAKLQRLNSQKKAVEKMIQGQATLTEFLRLGRLL